MLRHRQPNLRQNGFYQNLDSDSTHRLIYNDVDASGSVGCMSFLTKLFTRSKDTTAKSQPAPEMTQTTTPPPRSVPPPLSTGAPLVKGKKIPTVTLNNGVKMPMLGFGTYEIEPEGAVVTPNSLTTQCVVEAIKAGYPAFDTASQYHNEASIKWALEQTGRKRSDFFLTTKVAPIDVHDVNAALDASLKEFGTDYVDLLLVHWPVALHPNGKDDIPRTPEGRRDIDWDWDVVRDTWPQMEAAYKSGKARAIGVSNFSVSFMKRLIASAKVLPVMNQIETHPYLPSFELKELCEKNDIHITAYSPLGGSGSPLIFDQDVQAISKRTGHGPGAILLSWQVQRGVLVIPKSATASRIHSNLELVKLSKADMHILDNIHKRHSERFIKPDWRFPLGFPDWDSEREP